MNWMQWSKIIFLRCFIKIKDFIQQSKNVDEGFDTKKIQSYWNHQSDAKQHDSYITDCPNSQRIDHGDEDPELEAKVKQHGCIKEPMY